jgi:hypothetical protein
MRARFNLSIHSQAPEHTGPFATQNYGSVQEEGSVSPLARREDVVGRAGSL